MNKIIINYSCASPSAWTFSIPPIKRLLERYLQSGYNNWIDCFSGRSTLAQYRNDFDPVHNQPFQLQADEFCKLMSEYQDKFDGVLFDPPYSYRQITEHYKKLNLQASQLDTSNNFYNRVMNSICDRIKFQGYAISFGWNSSGFGMNRGFITTEILLVNHGSHHNDTICTVERKFK